MRRVVIMGAGGRDFHDFNVVFRNSRDTKVVAFTDAQIPGGAGRVYPASLTGALYPNGIPIRDETELPELIRRELVDEVVLAYSDLSHEDVMHKASLVLAAGADFRLLGPHATMLMANRPVVAVTGVRTGCGKSQTSRRIGKLLVAAGLRVALVRHPLRCDDLEGMRVQRFASLADIDAAHPTIEEREEYEPAVRAGMVVWAGVDYGELLAQAQEEADVVVWDGDNHDLPFFEPDLWVTVLDPLQPADELAFFAGETNLRLADVVLVNKVDSATAEEIDRVLEDIAAVNGHAAVIRAESTVTLHEGPPLEGKRVLVVEDGQALTHGGTAFGAGTVAARRAGAGELVDPRPYAVGSIADVYERYPHIGAVLPALGYSPEQLDELRRAIEAADVDVVVTGTPIDLSRLIVTRHPIRRATYELLELGAPTLADVLAPLVRLAQEDSAVATG